MKNYFILYNSDSYIYKYLMVDTKNHRETAWTHRLFDLFPADFRDPCPDIEWRHTHGDYRIIAEFDELPSSYEEFKKLYPEFCI